MANVLKIKRSNITNIPASLDEGELAYSEVSDKLFIGTIDDNVDTIGGKHYTQIVDKISDGTQSITGQAEVTADRLLFRDYSALKNQYLSLGTGLSITSTTLNLNVATSTAVGGIELFSDTQQSVAANSVTTTASRTYGLQINSAGQGVINVPWTDTVYTHPTGDGNLHVPATGTTNEGKVLTAGPTAGSLSWTEINSDKSVRVATTANITLSAPQIIDGVSVVAGNRVLVKNQSTGSANGIYVVAAGAWTRAKDADSASKLTSAFVFVEEGTTNKDTAWLQTADSITVGTTALTWIQFGGLASSNPLISAATAAIGTSVLAARQDHVHPIDADLLAIAALAGTSGFLKKTAANTWSLDTSTYLTTHPAVSGAASVDNSGITYIQDLTFDTNGHVTAQTSTAIRSATDALTGVVELATSAETQTGTDTARAVTPAGLAARTATETRTGVVELATTTEVATGTDTARAVTPAGFRHAGDLRYVLLSNLTGNRNITSIIATAGQTAFTVPTYLLGYDELDVYVNGVFQKVTATYVETNTTTITFTSGLSAGDIVDVRRTVSFGTANPSYLGASSQAVDSALLNGQNASYYLNADNFVSGTNKKIATTTEYNNWNTMFSWYSSMTTADADNFINTIQEILNAFSGASESLNILTELTTPSNMTLDCGTF